VSSLVPVCPEQLLDTKFWRIPEYWNVGMSEYRNIGTSECRSIGMSEYRNTGILSPESRKSSIPTFWKPLHFCSLLRGFYYSGVPVLRGRHTLEHWRVPDAELSRILRRHLFLNFIFECDNTLIPH